MAVPPPPTIHPFQISIPQTKLDRLHQKLALADFPDELDDANWDYGVPLAAIKRLTARWHTGYDWRKAEAELNATLPQFTVDIAVDGFETLTVHFVHQRSVVAGAIPLLFVHGWPGSFDEVRKLVPELVGGDGGEKSAPAFHVVAPSLVNFGFSQGTSKRGFTVRQHAEVCYKLMQALGYTQYVAQGGDIGYSILRTMALFYPESCKATHTNFANPSHPSARADPALFLLAQQTPLTAAEKAGYARGQWFATEGTGYNVQQSTKPQTIGYSVADSPVGLLAWIYEKLHDWSDHNDDDDDDDDNGGGGGYAWTDDEILTWVSIYYFSTAGPAASMRIYYESKHDATGNHRARLAEFIPDVKLGTAKFPRELTQFPKLWNRTLGPLVLASEWDRGGHFAAWERPDAIVQDLRDMFGKEGGAFAVVHGRTGY